MADNSKEYTSLKANIDQPIESNEKKKEDIQ